VLHEFADRMKYADRVEASDAAHRQARCTPLGSRSQPKIHSPRKVDSIMNATMPSIASGAPNTSPTNLEYADQVMPNWNSWTMPVTTPMAKLTSISLPQNLVIAR
jgi:hypothetical protein